MSNDLRRHPLAVTRRTAIAGLGTSGIGLALGTTARGIAAQDVASELASHPIVGAWYFDFDPANPGTLTVFTIFHADGTRTDLHPFAGPGIGSWVSTGERTGETILKYLNISDQPGVYVPGTVTVWESLSLDEAGESLTVNSVVELKTIDGTVVALFPFTGSASRRLTVEPSPPLGTPESGTPTT